MTDVATLINRIDQELAAEVNRAKTARAEWAQAARTHEQQAAGRSVGEPCDILCQFPGAGGVLQRVNAALHIKPAALGHAQQIRELPAAERRAGTFKVIYGHRPSIARRTSRMPRSASWPESWTNCYGATDPKPGPQVCHRRP